MAVELIQIGRDLGIVVRRIAMTAGERQRPCEDMGMAVDRYDALPATAFGMSSALARVSGNSSRASSTRA